MSELKIDEENIKQLCIGVSQLISHMIKDVQILEVKSNDVFLRYMAMVRLGAMYTSAQNGLELCQHTFGMGFDFQHEYFQTTKAKENGWDKVKIKDNPFFDQEDNKNDRSEEVKVEFKELPDELKEIITNAIKEKLQNQRPKQTH